ncbi:hypothetical protein WA026_011963 [Henosepilachna vigintioctopunctata]|uniref:Glycogen debranching enzyme n=1 Tax=Henosepilachna vigintioctopunctata TaxID=420089 RepID=A0AAW1VDR2_9CUCU
MIHFTPIQALGSSNSAYSLKDQLQLNPSFIKKCGTMPSWEEMKSFINDFKRDEKFATICDIVLNHTANDSVWIQEHPEVTYNCQNCMYMRPAYLLDAAFNKFSLDVKKGLYETKGIPTIVECEDHINAIRYHLLEGVLKELKLHELFICDVNKCVSQFLDIARQNRPLDEVNIDAELTIIQDCEYKRLGSSIDMDLALKIYNRFRPGCFDEDARVRKCCEDFKEKLDSLNQVIIDNVQNHLSIAVENIISGIRYWRVQADGPKLKEITIKDPLISRYFTDYGSAKSMKEYEEVMYSDKGKYLMAHNGWVQNIDPLVNFAGPDSTVYIRRELIAWGDSVKLRFGEKPSDCPFLWDHMKKYVEITASIFDGVRLDNCHSTPIHVAQYLLDAARKIRPDLYVVAELFTNSDEKDNIFVNKLGISSLIRESMSAWNSHELGRLVYRFGGVPVGSFYQPNTRPLVPSIAHALFMDLTHDNPSPIEKRSVFDMLPNSALVNMSCCGTGSNRGYDELVPHHISVVDETREYTDWSPELSDDAKYASNDTAIIEAKRVLNNVHLQLSKEGFDQIYVDQMDPDIVAVTRHCPKTHQSYILVAFTAFTHPGNNDYKFQRSIKPLVVEGVLDEIVLEATLSHLDFSNGGSKFAKAQCFKKSDKYINGYSEYKLYMKKYIQLSESEVFERTPSTNPNQIILNFKNFKPGSVVIIRVSLPKLMTDAVSDVRKVVQQFSSIKDTELKLIIRKLNLDSLNRVLYRCDQEERDEGKGFDTYDIPGYGKLVYSGLQGFMSLLSKIRQNNDLGHPMCNNLRNGTWMIDYIFQRLKLDEKTADLGKWIEENTRSLKELPKYLRPAYFDIFFTGLHELLTERSYSLMSDFVHKGSIFVKSLSMGSVQFAAYIKSADLPQLSPNLAEPKPDMRLSENGKKIQSCVSLSAGLPHFSVGYMRNWGRDTFIALRGLFILTGRYQEARYHILGYGACLRHGLIPNLLNGGRKSRYNCRDAVWWWLYCIKCYTEEVPNGINILEDKVSRIFPTDDSPPQQPGETDQILQDVMQEALTRHFQGLVFRERHAGREIDEHMNDNGFNNQIGVHPSTGFIFGGNVDNCGTWMDKMGSSTKAGNKGKPATPRDGSACEIVGLSKCVISWLAKLYDQKKYKYSGVERVSPNNIVTSWSFTYWADKIQNNFEKCFWVSEKPTEGEERPDLINRRGIYKDCFGSKQEWTDYQLRCNFPIVMVVAPELFNPQHAWVALEVAENVLADYDNSNDSQDKSVANGFNYHQGPEWVWPIGYFFRAKLYFAAKNGKLKETVAEVKYKLSRHFVELQTSDWRGLPELTNSNGSYCRDSSRTQAWSMSSILEVLHDLQKIDSSIV